MRVDPRLDPIRSDKGTSRSWRAPCWCCTCYASRSLPYSASVRRASMLWGSCCVRQRLSGREQGCCPSRGRRRASEPAVACIINGTPAMAHRRPECTGGELDTRYTLAAAGTSPRRKAIASTSRRPNSASARRKCSTERAMMSSRDTCARLLAIFATSRSCASGGMRR